MNRTTLIAVVMALALAACAAAGPPLATMPGADAGAARHNAEGLRQYEAGQWEAAREHFETALAEAPTLAVLHYNLGLTLDHLGAPAQATVHFRNAAELEPNNATFTQAATSRVHHDPPSARGGTFEREVGVGVTPGTAVPYPLNQR
jgi:Tfp pilus assembly protein PilF